MNTDQTYTPIVLSLNERIRERSNAEKERARIVDDKHQQLYDAVIKRRHCDKSNNAEVEEHGRIVADTKQQFYDAFFEMMRHNNNIIKNAFIISLKEQNTNGKELTPDQAELIQKIEQDIHKK